MESLTCQDFFRRSGWRCKVITGQGGDCLYISSPLVLADGKPLDFYLECRGSIVLFTDDGLTLFSLRNYGFVLDDRRNWKGLENIAQLYGFAIDERGAIEGTFQLEQLQLWMGRILKMFCAITTWQTERMEQEDEDFSLTKEVERLLRLKAPNRPIDHNVSLRLGKSEFTFDFLWGSIYVDAVPPIPQAVNSRLRKGILAAKEGSSDVSLLFVLDDRKYPDKADRELGVLGQVAHTVRLSDFADSYVIPG